MVMRVTSCTMQALSRIGFGCNRPWTEREPPSWTGLKVEQRNKRKAPEQKRKTVSYAVI